MRMDKGFWGKLKKPIVGLAPMDGVTDAPMRYITAKYGRPDVIFTEFVSAEGLRRVTNGNKSLLATRDKLASRNSSRNSLLRHLKYDEIERPVVAQLFGGEPESFFEVTKLIVKMGFDGVDINMGCPARKVAGRGEGAGLIKNPELAGEIIAAVKKAVSQCHSATGKLIPVSVKTRIGYEQADPNWWEFLATQDLAAVTVHGRTFKQLYQGTANWEAIGEAATLIKQSGAIFLGSGDVSSISNAEFLISKYGVDGVLIGRAAEGNPWVFERTQGIENSRTQDNSKLIKKRLAIAIEHSRKFEEVFPNDRFFIMRKHLSWYARGFDGASDLRQKLVMCNSADEVERVLQGLTP